MAISMALSFNRFGSAIWAIVLRELRAQYGDRKLGFFWAFSQPVAYIFVVSVAMAAVRGERTSELTGDFAPFVTLGLLNLNLFSAIEGSVRNAVSGNKGLLSFPRIKVLDLYISKMVVEVAINLIVFSALMLIFVILGHVPPPKDPIRFFLPMSCAIISGFSFGVINSVVSSLYKTWNNIFTVAVRINFFTAGLFFLARDMPPEIQQALYFQPLLHTAEEIRSAWYPDFESQFVDMRVPVWTSAALLLFALLLERVLRGKVLSKL
ncbi:ABC transporter permease [Oryzibacter oryziterrae]|uniref:ABC transporter permease n=1 Tax=Oryzibacter oryziterrae TaxID=2766474 RepID=UPI001F01BFAA|nr:ABC transporter permease [Oryzibacter oryziterrae]